MGLGRELCAIAIGGYSSPHRRGGAPFHWRKVSTRVSSTPAESRRPKTRIGRADVLNRPVEAQMAVDAIPPGGKVLRTVSGHSNTFMQITDTQIWKVRPTPGAVPGGLSAPASLTLHAHSLAHAVPFV